MQIKSFYKRSQAEIVKCFREFIEVDMFSRYPELRGKISLIKTFTELKKEHLTGWGHDDSLREYSIALIVTE